MRNRWSQDRNGAHVLLNPLSGRRRAGSLAVGRARYARTVIGWAMGHRLTVALAERARTIALTQRTPLAGWLPQLGSRQPGRGTPRPAAARRAPPADEPHGPRLGPCLGRKCFGTLTRELVSLGATPPVTKRHRISSSPLRCSTIGGDVTPGSATIPRTSSKRGRLWLNQVSTELGEGQK